MNVLVTGGAGFVGTHLTNRLLQSGSNVFCADRIFRRNNPRVKYFQVSDINGSTDWRPILDGVDAIVHLAAHAHVLKPKVEDFAKYKQTNVEGTRQLFEQAASHGGVKHFVFFSSVGAVANASDQLIDESSPCNPISDYGKSKLAGEDIIRNSKFGLSFTIVRPPLVYGQNNPGNMARLIKLIKLGLPLPLASISNRRSFVFIGNLADAIARLICNPKSYNKTFFISDGSDLSTPELIVRLCKAMNKKPRLVPVPVCFLKRCCSFADRFFALAGKKTDFGDTFEKLTSSLAVSSHLFVRTLEWTPPYSVDDGIKSIFAEKD